MKYRNPEQHGEHNRKQVYRSLLPTTNARLITTGRRDENNALQLFQTYIKSPK